MVPFGFWRPENWWPLLWCTHAHQSNSCNVNQLDLLLVFRFVIVIMCPWRQRLIFGNQSSFSMRNATSLGIPLFKLGCIRGLAPPYDHSRVSHLLLLAYIIECCGNLGLFRFILVSCYVSSIIGDPDLFWLSSYIVMIMANILINWLVEGLLHQLACRTCPSRGPCLAHPKPPRYSRSGDLWGPCLVSGYKPWNEAQCLHLLESLEHHASNLQVFWCLLDTTAIIWWSKIQCLWVCSKQLYHDYSVNAAPWKMIWAMLNEENII